MPKKARKSISAFGCTTVSNEEALNTVGSSLTMSGSYDTIGKLTFGQTSGYLKSGKDFNGLIDRQKQFLDYVNVVSILIAEQDGVAY